MMPAMDARLGRYPLSITIPVAWGEMDAFHHVNNVVYARWIESARVAYFTRIGLMEPVRADGVGPILGRLAIDYRRPVTYPDSVRIDATTTRIGGRSFTMAYRIVSVGQGAEVAVAEDVIVVFDYRAGRSTAVDSTLRAAILAFEASGPARPDDAA
jgi:acyl-CoA thioester hydrolase